jgi:RluA family pseudouridine synthase
VSAAIKLSSPATSGFWEIPVLFEDEHLLALDKPAGLAVSPDRNNLARPSLMALLHAGIAAAKPWAVSRNLTYLANAHRLDAETSGVLLLAKNKPTLIALANLFGSEKPFQKYIVLVHGTPLDERFEVGAKVAPHPFTPGKHHVDARRGKKSKTIFTAIERFINSTLLRCEPATSRPHQIRVHLHNVGWPVVGDELYGGQPLLLSRLKPHFRLKPGKVERPLLATAMVHAEELSLLHPVTGETLTVTAPWPKDLTVAVKYLRLYAAA